MIHALGHELRTSPGILPLRQVARTRVPTRWGVFGAIGFEVTHPQSRPGVTRDLVALRMGNPRDPRAVHRLHSQCLTGDAFGSLRCDCGQQFEAARQAIAFEGNGLLIYEPDEGRGIGIRAKLRAYELQNAGLDTVEANLQLGLPVDARDYACACSVLLALGVRSVRLMTNNPDKVHAVESFEIKVAERIGAGVSSSPHAAFYVRTKREKLGHYWDASDG